MSIAEKLTTIAENEQKVYDAGYAEGVEAGKDQRDLEWWRAYQHVDEIGGGWFNSQFAGCSWDQETFKPRFDIKVHSSVAGTANGNTMFYQHNHAKEAYDMVEHLGKLGIELDLSRFSAMVQCFQYARVSRVGVIDWTAISSAYGSHKFFANSWIETIDKLVMAEKTFDYYGTEFDGCSFLKHLIIEGVIANNKLNFSACVNLTKASHVSIVEHIHATKTISITFSKVAVNTAFETSAGAADGSTSPEWLALVATRPNCTISLA